MTHVYLMHYLFGPGAEPYSEKQARAKLSGTRLFEQGKCVVCRSRGAMASFSWFDSGSRLMACVTPMELDCLMLPKFRSLIGTIGGKIDEIKIAGRSIRTAPGSISETDGSCCELCDLPSETPFTQRALRPR